MIQKRGNSYRIRVYNGLDPITGKERYKNATASGWEDAKNLHAKMILEADDSPDAPIKTRSFSSWSTEWLKRQSRRLMPNTMAAYYQYIESASARIGMMKMGDIEEHHILRYLEDLADGLAGAKRGKDKPHMTAKSQNTIAKHFWILRKLFRDALKGESPMEYMESPKRTDPEIDLPEDEEVDALLHRIDSDIDLKVPVILAERNGMRLGEIFALDWRDIKATEIRVNKSLKQERGGGWVEGKPKSKYSVRDIAMDNQTKELLAQHRNRDGISRMSGRVMECTLNSFSSKLSNILKKELHVRFTFHGLRHYHLTQLYYEGFDIKYIATRAGHSMAVLQGIYIHLKVKMRVDQDEKIRNRSAK